MTKSSAAGPATPAVERSPLPSAQQADRRRFARRLIAGGIAIAMAMLAITGLVLWNLRQNTVATALTDLDSFDLLLAAETERTFENVDLVVSGIIADLRADGIKSSAELRRLKGDETTHRFLREKLSGVPQLYALSLVSAEGDVINSTRSYPFKAINVADRDYFVALRDHPELDRFISMPVQNRGSGAWTVYFARRLSAPDDGSFSGVVLGAMTLEYFEAFFREVSPVAGRGINLWRTDGTLIARYPASANIGRTFELHEKFHHIAAHGGGALFWTTETSTQTPMAIAERKLHDFPLVVAVSLTKAKILAPWYMQAIIIASGVFALLIALALAAWLLLRQIAAYALVTEARIEADRETEAREALQRAVDRAEQAVHDLRQSETRFRDIAEVSGDWIWESDAQHRLTRVLGHNVLHQENDGISSLGAVGRTCWELAGADPEKDEAWRAHKADLEAHRPFRNFRFIVGAANGSELHFRVSGKPVFDETGKFIGYRGTASNETDLVVALSRAERADTLLHEAIESISEGFAIYDADDRLALCNEAYKNLYPESAAFMVPGATFVEILRGGLANGQYADAIGREDEWLAERVREHREPGTPIEQPLRDGRWALVSERRLSNGGRAGLRIDITAFKNIQQSLRESQERLARAQRVSNTGSIERDLRTNRVEWSDETYRIMGLQRDLNTPTPQLFLDRVHPDDRKVIIDRMFGTVLQNHTSTDIRYRIVRPDGEVRTIYAEACFLCDKDGKPARLIAVIKDVTEAEAATQRQAQLEAQLRHSEKLTALGTLAGGIAHDLNNMLVPIQALTKLVMRDLPTDSAARADLETVVQASMQARDLVRQILAFSRKQEIVKKPVDLARVTGEALQMLRASIPRTIEIVEELRPVPSLLGDAGQLHQVIVNLVSNAAHAIGDRIGRIIVSIAPAMARDGETGKIISLKIVDTGCGMDAATVHRVFEPFYTTKPVGEGTGLGLSVVHGIVMGHGGSIEVNSAPGKGSEFIIRLPSCDADIAARTTELASA